LADFKLYGEWDWAGAEQGFKRTNELNPNLAMNHYHYAWYLALFGRLDEAIREHKRAQELDPFEPLHTVWLGYLYFWDGQFEKAMNEARKALDLNPDDPTSHWLMGEVYAEKEMYEEAIAAAQKAAELAPSEYRWALGRIYALTGQTEEARKIIAELEEKEATPWGTLTLGQLCATLGEMDRAFQWLEAAYELHTAWLPWIRVDHITKPLRDDPRFKDLLRRMNLPELE